MGLAADDQVDKDKKAKKKEEDKKKADEKKKEEITKELEEDENKNPAGTLAKAGVAIVAVLVADDVTIVGAADNVLIPHDLLLCPF